MGKSFVLGQWGPVGPLTGSSKPQVGKRGVFMCLCLRVCVCVRLCVCLRVFVFACLCLSVCGCAVYCCNY